MPRGIGTLISMILAGRLVTKIDPRLVILLGLSLMALSLWQMSGFSLDMDKRPVIISGVVQGLALGFIFVPMNLMAFATLDGKHRTTAASLLNLSRSIGGSIGISIVSVLLARNLQVSHSDLVQHITPAALPQIDPSFTGRAGQLSDTALAMIDAEINRQALMIAYVDDFHLMMIIALCAAPLLLLLRPRRSAAKDDHPPVME